MTAGEREAFHDMRRVDFEREQMERAEASVIREYLKTKALLPEKEWLRREPRGTHPAILEAVRDFTSDGGFHYDDDVERHVNALAGDLPRHEPHGAGRHRLLKQLGREVYLARHIVRDEENERAAQRLRDAGYTPLAEFEAEHGGRYMLAAGTLYSGYRVPVYHAPKAVRAHVTADNRLVFLPKGARTRAVVPMGPAMIREGWTS